MKRWMLVIGLCLGVLGLTAPRAEAYYGVLDLTYDEEGDDLSGYAGVFREPWDPSYYYWYEGSCECYIYYESSVGELARLYTPSGSLFAGNAAQAVDYVYFALPPFVPNEAGVWTARADHTVYHRYWDPYGIACGGYQPCEDRWTNAWSQQRTATAGCGNATVAGMRQEYFNRPDTGFIPFCFAFRNSGGSPNFTWSELNDGWSGGNEPAHNPWGIMLDHTVAKLEETRTNFNKGRIIVSSGYRCPNGNFNVGGVANSRHMRGQAIDMYAAVYGRGWIEMEFNELREAARLTGPVELLFFNSYTDHHLHAAWE